MKKVIVIVIFIIDNYHCTIDYKSHSMIKEYKYEFNDCKKWQVTVDATPSYVSIPEVPERVKSSYSSPSLSKKKFVVLLRDPVSRHYSEYQRVLRICFRAIEGDPELEHGTITRSPAEKLERAKSNCAFCLKNTPSSSSLILKKENAMTFAEFVDSPYGTSEMERGNYLYNIQRWLNTIDRSQLFIMNFQQLIQNTTGNHYIVLIIIILILIIIDVMFRLSSFLNIDPKMFIHDNATKISLPKPPASNSYVIWDPAYLDCKTFDRLEKYFNETNAGLIDFINKAPKKPKDEPLFLPFASYRSKCK